jgi:hypothetical protein
VRVAIGWIDGDVFEPIAHSPAIEPTPKRTGSGGSLVHWTLRGAHPVQINDDERSPIGLALSGARRAVTALRTRA